MELYNDMPSEYKLVGKPSMHPFISETLVLSTMHLQSHKPYYALPDKRANRIRMILMYGTFDFDEYVEFFIPMSTTMRRDSDPCCNWWTESHAWVLNDAGKQDPLTIIFLNEEYLDVAQTKRKMALMSNSIDLLLLL
jgi:hypothetical protein